MHPATLRTTRSRRSLLRNRQSRSRLSPWTAWQMATSRQLTAARLHVTSPGHACTTRCRTRVTTFPRRLQTHSPVRSWNWQIFDHTQPECDAPDSASEEGPFRVLQPQFGMPMSFGLCACQKILRWLIWAMFQVVSLDANLIHGKMLIFPMLELLRGTSCGLACG